MGRHAGRHGCFLKMEPVSLRPPSRWIALLGYSEQTHFWHQCGDTQMLRGSRWHFLYPTTVSAPPMLRARAARRKGVTPLRPLRPTEDRIPSWPASHRAWGDRTGPRRDLSSHPQPPCPCEDPSRPGPTGPEPRSHPALVTPSPHPRAWKEAVGSSNSPCCSPASALDGCLHRGIWVEEEQIPVLFANPPREPLSSHSDTTPRTEHCLLRMSASSPSPGQFCVPAKGLLGSTASPGCCPPLQAGPGRPGRGACGRHSFHARGFGDRSRGFLLCHACAPPDSPHEGFGKELHVAPRARRQTPSGTPAFGREGVTSARLDRAAQAPGVTQPPSGLRGGGTQVL